MSNWRVLRARLAATRRHHPEADLGPLERELRAARLADAITRAISQDPPLTFEERYALAALLLPDGLVG